MATTPMPGSEHLVSRSSGSQERQARRTDSTTQAESDAVVPTPVSAAELRRLELDEQWRLSSEGEG